MAVAVKPNAFVISGSLCAIFTDGYPTSVITNMGINTKRDIQQNWAMTQNPGAQGYTLNLRRVGIDAEVAPFNGVGARGIIPNTPAYEILRGAGEGMTATVDGKPIYNLDDLDGNEDGSLSDEELAGVEVEFGGQSTIQPAILGPLAVGDLLRKALSEDGTITLNKGPIDYIDQAVATTISLVGVVPSIEKSYTKAITGCMFHTEVYQIGISSGGQNNVAGHAFGHTIWEPEDISDGVVTMPTASSVGGVTG